MGSRDKDDDPQEAARLEALADYQILDTAAEAAFDRLTQLAATFYQTPIALVSLVDTDRQWFKSRVGLSAEQTPRDIAFCNHAITGDDTFIVNDATKDPRFRDNPLVTGAPEVRFYAGAPLKTPEGHKIGTLCIIDRSPREAFGEADAEQLRLLSEIVISEMELRVKNLALERAIAEAERANAARSDFLSMVSHEIRNPLGAVIGLADMLAERPLGDKEGRIVEGIQSSSRILMGLLNDLLDFAKAKAGKLELSPTRVRMGAFAETLEKAWTSVASDKGLAFSVDATEALPELVSMDDLRVSQILNNLLSNAMKFTRRGSVAVRITRADGDAAALCFTVKDTGCGMSEEQLSRLFNPFEQADRSISRNYGGTGLGMAITWNLLEMMGGSIQCASEPGRGTEFRVRVPVGAVAPAPATPRPDREPRVLLVDDVAVNRLVVARMLTTLGCTVDEAQSGEQALAAAAAGDFDLILMDIHMPGIGGLEAARRILASKPGARIVALSADAMPQDAHGAAQAGMVASLVKPVSLEALRSIVEDAAGR